MIRIFGQISPASKVIYNILQCTGIPGDNSESVPSDFVELTYRKDGPWLGKVYNSVTDTFSAPAVTKNDIEFGRARALYETWQAWKNTRLEAQARAMSAGIITALTNRENAAWTDYAQALLEWNSAI